MALVRSKMPEKTVFDTFCDRNGVFNNDRKLFQEWLMDKGYMTLCLDTKTLDTEYVAMRTEMLDEPFQVGS